MKKKSVRKIAGILLTGMMMAGIALAGEKVTLQTLFDMKIYSQLSVPQHAWLNNGKVILLDGRVPREKQTLEWYDLQTGKRTPVFEAERFRTVLKEVAGESAPESVYWPDALDLNGNAAAYLLGGDIYVIDLAAMSAKRLTKTDSEEDSIAFSPDGQWLGFIRDNELYAVDWKSGTEKRLTWGATKDLLNGALSWVYWEEIYDHTSVPYAWSPDSKAIAYLQTDDSPVSISTFVNFQPQTQGVVRQRYPKAGQTNPTVRLGIVELGSGQTIWADCGYYEYLARFNWLPESREIAVQTMDRKQAELRLLFADRQTGKSREILVERQPAWINLNDSLYFLKDGKRFIWMSERDGYQHLYLYGRDGKLLLQLTKGEFMVLPSEGAIVSRNGGLAGVDEKKGLVYFTSNQTGLKERQLYCIKFDGKGLKKLSNGPGVHAASLSPDGRFFLDAFSSATVPPELSLFKAEGTKAATITPPAKEFVASFDLNYPEYVTFKTEDGLELPAAMTKPAQFDPGKKYPAIVYVYGGPGAQQVVDQWSGRIFWHTLLAQEGAYVLIFEVRAGMGKSKALETSVYKHGYGIQNVKDITDGVKWLKQMPSVDPNRLGIWGGSGGGCTTLFVMTHSDAFKAGISLYPVSDWNYYDTIYTERYQSTPQENPEGYKDTSSVLAAANLKGRLLIAHGTYDDNVHPQNTEAFINALIANNIQFELMIYPWRKHGIGDPPARKHLYTLMLDFWRRNLLR